MISITSMKVMLAFMLLCYSHKTCSQYQSNTPTFMQQPEKTLTTLTITTRDPIQVRSSMKKLLPEHGMRHDKTSEQNIISLVASKSIIFNTTLRRSHNMENSQKVRNDFANKSIIPHSSISSHVNYNNLHSRQAILNTQVFHTTVNSISINRFHSSKQLLRPSPSTILDYNETNSKSSLKKTLKNISKNLYSSNNQLNSAVSFIEDSKRNFKRVISIANTVSTRSSHFIFNPEKLSPSPMDSASPSDEGSMGQSKRIIRKTSAIKTFSFSSNHKEIKIKTIMPSLTRKVFENTSRTEKAVITNLLNKMNATKSSSKQTKRKSQRSLEKTKDVNIVEINTAPITARSNINMVAIKTDNNVFKSQSPTKNTAQTRVITEMIANATVDNLTLKSIKLSTAQTTTSKNSKISLEKRLLITTISTGIVTESPTKLSSTQTTKSNTSVVQLSTEKEMLMTTKSKDIVLPTSTQSSSTQRTKSDNPVVQLSTQRKMLMPTKSKNILMLTPIKSSSTRTTKSDTSVVQPSTGKEMLTTTKSTDIVIQTSTQSSSTQRTKSDISVVQLSTQREMSITTKSKDIVLPTPTKLSSTQRTKSNTSVVQLSTEKEMLMTTKSKDIVLPTPTKSSSTQRTKSDNPVVQLSTQRKMLMPTKSKNILMLTPIKSSSTRTTKSDTSVVQPSTGKEMLTTTKSTDIVIQTSTQSSSTQRTKSDISVVQLSTQREMSITTKSKDIVLPTPTKLSSTQRTKSDTLVVQLSTQKEILMPIKSKNILIPTSTKFSSTETKKSDTSVVQLSTGKEMLTTTKSTDNVIPTSTQSSSTQRTKSDISVVQLSTQREMSITTKSKDIVLPTPTKFSSVQTTKSDTSVVQLSTEKEMFMTTKSKDILIQTPTKSSFTQTTKSDTLVVQLSTQKEMVMPTKNKNVVIPTPTKSSFTQTTKSDTLVVQLSTQKEMLMPTKNKNIVIPTPTKSSFTQTTKSDTLVVQLSTQKEMLMPTKNKNIVIPTPTKSSFTQTTKSDTSVVQLSTQKEMLMTTKSKDIVIPTPPKSSSTQTIKLDISVVQPTIENEMSITTKSKDIVLPTPTKFSSTQTTKSDTSVVQLSTEKEMLTTTKSKNILMPTPTKSSFTQTIKSDTSVVQPSTGKEMLTTTKSKNILMPTPTKSSFTQTTKSVTLVVQLSTQKEMLMPTKSKDIVLPTPTKFSSTQTIKLDTSVVQPTIENEMLTTTKSKDILMQTPTISAKTKLLEKNAVTSQTQLTMGYESFTKIKMKKVILRTVSMESLEPTGEKYSKTMSAVSSTQIPTTSNEKLFSILGTLEQIFLDDLNDKNSDAYKNLSTELSRKFADVLEGSGLRRTKINKFSAGSIVFDATLSFDSSSTIDAMTIKSLLESGNTGISDVTVKALGHSPSTKYTQSMAETFPRDSMATSVARKPTSNSLNVKPTWTNSRKLDEPLTTSLLDVNTQTLPYATRATTSAIDKPYVTSTLTYKLHIVSPNRTMVGSPVFSTAELTTRDKVTRESPSATSTMKQMTSKNHSTTPTMKYVTSESHLATPTMKYVTSENHSATPTMKYVTSENHLATPTMKYVTSENHSATPTMKYVTSENHSATPTMKYVTSENHSATPTMKYVTSENHITTPTMEYVTNENNLSTPTMKYLASENHSATATMNYVTSKNHSTTPTMKYLTSENHSSTPTMKYMTSENHSSTPTMKYLTSENHSSTPTMKYVASENHSATATMKYVTSKNHSTTPTMKYLTSENHSSTPTMKYMTSENHLPTPTMKYVTSENHSATPTMKYMTSENHSATATMKYVTSENHSTTPTMKYVTSENHSATATMKYVTSKNHSATPTMKYVIRENHSTTLTMKYVTSENHSATATMKYVTSENHIITPTMKYVTGENHSVSPTMKYITSGNHFTISNVYNSATTLTAILKSNVTGASILTPSWVQPKMTNVRSTEYPTLVATSQESNGFSRYISSSLYLLVPVPSVAQNTHITSTSYFLPTKIIEASASGTSRSTVYNSIISGSNKFSVRGKLQQNFTSDLENPDSKSYKTLTKNVSNLFEKLLRNLGLLRVSINKFSAGSIVFDATLSFDSSSTIDSTTIKLLLENKSTGITDVTVKDLAFVTKIPTSIFSTRKTAARESKVQSASHLIKTSPTKSIQVQHSSHTASLSEETIPTTVYEHSAPTRRVQPSRSFWVFSIHPSTLLPSSFLLTQVYRSIKSKTLTAETGDTITVHLISLNTSPTIEIPTDIKHSVTKSSSNYTLQISHKMNATLTLNKSMATALRSEGSTIQTVFTISSPVITSSTFVERASSNTRFVPSLMPTPSIVSTVNILPSSFAILQSKSMQIFPSRSKMTSLKMPLPIDSSFALNVHTTLIERINTSMSKGTTTNTKIYSTMVPNIFNESITTALNKSLASISSRVKNESLVQKVPLSTEALKKTISLHSTSHASFYSNLQSATAPITSILLMPSQTVSTLSLSRMMQESAPSLLSTSSYHFTSQYSARMVSISQHKLSTTMRSLFSSGRLTSTPSLKESTVSSILSGPKIFLIQGRLNETFTPDLENPDSEASQKLSKRLNVEFAATFDKLGLLKSEITGFSPGSVIFDAALYFDPTSTIDKNSLGNALKGSGVTDVTVTELSLASSHMPSTNSLQTSTVAKRSLSKKTTLTLKSVELTTSVTKINPTYVSSLSSVVGTITSQSAEGTIQTVFALSSPVITSSTFVERASSNTRFVPSLMPTPLIVSTVNILPSSFAILQSKSMQIFPSRSKMTSLKMPLPIDSSFALNVHTTLIERLNTSMSKGTTTNTKIYSTMVPNIFNESITTALNKSLASISSRVKNESLVQKVPLSTEALKKTISLHSTSHASFYSNLQSATAPITSILLMPSQTVSTLSLSRMMQELAPSLLSTSSYHFTSQYSARMVSISQHKLSTTMRSLFSSGRLTSTPSLKESTVSSILNGPKIFLIQGRLNETFTPDLENPDSEASQKLSKRLNVEFAATFDKLGLLKSEITGFSPGSVIFDAALYFDPTSTIDKNSLGNALKGSGVTDVTVTELSLASSHMPSTNSLQTSTVAKRSLSEKTTLTLKSVELTTSVTKINPTYVWSLSSVVGTITSQSAEGTIQTVFALSSPVITSSTFVERASSNTRFVPSLMPTPLIVSTVNILPSSFAILQSKSMQIFPSRSKMTSLKMPLPIDSSFALNVHTTLIERLNTSMSKGTTTNTKIYSTMVPNIFNESITTALNKSLASISSRVKNESLVQKVPLSTEALKKTISLHSTSHASFYSNLQSATAPITSILLMPSQTVSTLSLSRMMQESTPSLLSTSSQHKISTTMRSLFSSGRLTSTPSLKESTVSSILNGPKIFLIQGRLNETFTPDLENPDSEASQKLSKRLNVEFAATFDKLGLLKSEITGFSPGSVIFDAALYFDPTSTIDKNSLGNALKGSGVTDVTVTEISFASSRMPSTNWHQTSTVTKRSFFKKTALTLKSVKVATSMIKISPSYVSSLSSVVGTSALPTPLPWNISNPEVLYPFLKKFLKFSVHGQVNEDFNEELDDPSSTYYQNLSNRLTNQIKKLLSPYGLNNSFVIQLSSGSVFFRAWLYFDQLSNISTNTMARVLENTFINVTVRELCVINTCSDPSQGVCEETSSGDTTCKCKEGFNGKRCSNPIAKYSPWSGWTDCTKSCGGGTKNRTRECISTVKNGGRCNDGSNIDIMNTTCNEHSCSSAQSDDDYVLAVAICAAFVFLIIIILIVICCRHKNTIARRLSRSSRRQTHDLANLNVCRVPCLPRRPERYNERDKNNVITLKITMPQQDESIYGGELRDQNLQDSSTIDELYKQQVEKYYINSPQIRSTTC
ncbi:mucin-16-like [Hydractinia symbiolongicarpus]|uniref:mucin-16-like n=1 Tax=Hydractinia symbiolongicarpus TaxID=13093 RepID=UPI00254FEEB5|nr:mucin-16-like [Hydractinia symbiolongicarpus]